MRIATVDIKKLKPASYNPRTISSEVLNLLKKNIKEFGVVDPLIINKKNNHVVGGNQRLQALKDLKFKKVPVVWVDLNLKKEKALNLALNKISGDWDYDKLKSIFSDIESKNFDLDLTGFSLKEVKNIITDKDFLNKFTSVFELIIKCSSEKNLKQVFNKFKKEGYTCRLLIS